MNHRHIFVDGTFSVCRNLDFKQIYIFSVCINNSTNTKVFSYPFMKFMMIYYEKFQTKLNIPVFHCDAEIGFINAAKFVFPDIEILLCSEFF